MKRARLLGVLLLAACNDEPIPETNAMSASGEGPRAGAPWFSEEARARGLVFRHVSGHGKRFLFPEIMCGGAGLLDIDADGDLDAYLVQAGGIEVPREDRPGNQLFANDGAGRFADVSAASAADDRGYGMGVAVGDADDDGDPDLYVTNLGPNVMLANDGSGRFQDVSASSGTDDPSWSTSASFLDFDRDGDLDLYVANYVQWSLAGEHHCETPPYGADYCNPASYDAPAPDTLYRNDGGGLFTDVSSRAGLRRAFGHGLGLGVADFDDDGWIDVFVANDGMRNQLWHNQGDGTFLDEADARGCAVDHDGRAKAGMGVAVADIDDDADPDLLIVNLAGEADTFYRNEGRFFADRTPLVGLGVASRSFTRFGVGLHDLDDDGWLDLYQANGRVTHATELAASDPFAEENLLWRGIAAGRFELVSPRGGTAEALVATSRAAAFGDVDGDGGLDVIVVNRDADAHLLMNRAPGRGHWIRFQLKERNGRDALGATLELSIGERRIVRTLTTSTSYCAASEPLVHVGLGGASGVENVMVRWVDGVEEHRGDLAGGRVHVVQRESSGPPDHER